jgi:hypothetical protein
MRVQPPPLQLFRKNEMKIIKTETKSRSAVAGSNLAHIEATDTEITELVNALKIIEQFKYTARKACNTNDKNADWTEYHFEIHRREGVVIVDIKQGMAG